MSGIQEILVIILIITVLLAFTRRRPATGKTGRKPARLLKIKLPGRLRLAIVLSILWSLTAAACFQVWKPHNMFPFLYFGIGPVVLGWSIKWVIAGFQKHPPQTTNRPHHTELDDDRQGRD